MGAKQPAFLTDTDLHILRLKASGMSWEKVAEEMGGFNPKTALAWAKRLRRLFGVETNEAAVLEYVKRYEPERLAERAKDGAT